MLCFFRETFGDSNVGLLTGDSAVNKDAQVLIMTTEILRNMLYERCIVLKTWTYYVTLDFLSPKQQSYTFEPLFFANVL